MISGPESEFCTIPTLLIAQIRWENNKIANWVELSIAMNISIYDNNTL